VSYAKAEGEICRDCNRKIEGRNAKKLWVSKKTQTVYISCRVCANAANRERYNLKAGNTKPVNKEAVETERLKLIFAEFRKREALNKPWLRHPRKDIAS